MFKFIRFLVTHGIALAAGFVLGIYLLPILIAPEGPSDAEVMANRQQALFQGRFQKDLPGSDFLHWGEGEIAISNNQVSFIGEIAPGPDYQLYLTRDLVLTEAGFLQVKADAVKIGPIVSFENFLLQIPPDIDPAEYRALIVWCETFGEFITAASYQ